MKKFATLAVLAAISSTAAAQSSVTLFGILDANVRYVKNGDNKMKSLASNGANTSRLGVRGIEDLGGGLQAGFWLETGLNPDTGTQSDTTRFWNRRSTVSLSSTTLGEVRLGRDYTPTYLGYADYDAFGTNGVASSDKFDSSLGTNRDTGTRADNQVSYLTPRNLGGFYGRASVAAGEGVAGKRYVGGRVGYAAGPLDVSAAYGQTTVTPVGGEDKFKTLDVGAAYDFGIVKAMAYYTQSKIASRKLAVYNLGAQMPMGQGLVRASYIHANASGTTPAGVSTSSDDADQIALGYIYHLSKRTGVYSTVARVRNKGAAAFAVDSKPALVAGEDSTGFELGLRHIF